MGNTRNSLMGNTRNSLMGNTRNSLWVIQEIAYG